MDAMYNDLNKKILKITSMIREKYPELYIQLEEMSETLTISEHPEVDIKNLANYYESLKEMVTHYIEEKDKDDLYILNHL